MVYRRILYLGQFAAAVALPAWVLITRGLLDNGVGWEFLVYLVICPLLGFAMLAVAGLTMARRSVRTARAVSWLDAAVASAWYAVIIAYGLWAWTALAVLIVLTTLVALWVAVWQFVVETRKRFRSLLAGFDEASRPPSRRNVIVVNQSEDDASH